jgi:hypothetical protein
MCAWGVFQEGLLANRAGKDNPGVQRTCFLVRILPAAAGVIQGALGVAAGAVATASELVDGRFQKDLTADIPGPSFLHQIIPRTFKNGFNPLCRGDQDIDFPGLDSLLIADRERFWGPTAGPGDARFDWVVVAAVLENGDAADDDGGVADTGLVAAQRLVVANIGVRSDRGAGVGGSGAMFRWW